MWTRAELKQRAKNVLSTSYWKAFLVSIILMIVGGGYSPPSFNYNYNSTHNSYTGNGSESFGDFFAVFLGIFIVAFLVILAFTLAFRIFLGFPLEVGSMKYFKRAAEYEVNLNHLGYGFNRNRYWDIVKAMFWKGLLNFLWYLLLIIPGIIKYYAYSMVPFILADNPNIGSKRAVELSNQMTRGHKFNIFVLDLSFLGWILLGTLACFVGVIFVAPYINATKAELYLALRHEALLKGETSLEELKLAPPPPMHYT